MISKWIKQFVRVENRKTEITGVARMQPCEVTHIPQDLACQYRVLA